MPQEQINRNPDLKRLMDEGYAVAIVEDCLLLYEIPYVDSSCQIQYGTLVSDLTSIAGDNTNSPISQHVAYWAGELPCYKDGSPIKGIHSGSQDTQMGGIIINHSFSNKPAEGYKDYSHKMSNYANIISAEARALNKSVTEKPFKDINIPDSGSVFNYPDTNISRGKINAITKKLEGQKVAIVGLGGTGSYILDLIAKTPIQEIHLFDEDVLLNHNAFRSPGAPPAEKLTEVNKKTDYFQSIYANMHKNIHSHSYNITAEKIDELSGMSFVFIAMDKGTAKRQIINHLIAKQISFVDAGIGLLTANDSILGHVRVTSSTADKRDHINKRISFAEKTAADDYVTNIQIADINALSATLSVMKWKKISGFYQDRSKEFNTIYSMNDGKLFNEDYNS
ncbi:MAG: ThiF family adenylyltransferase [bacterium]|nr:ThiF family adenylyltransferase [bacterium]